MTRPIDRVLARLEERGGPLRKAGEGRWLALCPAHDDREPSLSVAEGDDGRALLKCHAGCSNEDVVGELGLDLRDLFPHAQEPPRRFPSVSRRTPEHASGNGHGTCPSAGENTDGASVRSVRAAPNAARTAEQPGLTLAEFAAARRLDPARLAREGVKDGAWQGRPCVVVPYYGPEGELLAVRRRIAMDGDRFRWRSGDKAHLYGLHRLREARHAGWALLVEGESDCWACWQAGLPALGIPGKTAWQEGWATMLQGLEVIAWQEPEAGDLSERLARDLPELRLIVADGHKDPCSVHAAGLDLAAYINERRARAPLARDRLATRRRAQAEARLAELEPLAAPVFEHPAPLEFVEWAARELGWGGESGAVLLTYLAATSRLLARARGRLPVHVLLLGPASAGKSYCLATVAALLPEEAVHRIDAGSPRALIYDEASLEHRVVVFGEADSLPAGEDNPAASAVRNLLQDGELAYDVVERHEATGRQVTRKVRRPGPTVLITTATRPLGQQLMTRLLSVEIPDNHEQLRAALAMQAILETQDAPAQGSCPRVAPLVAAQALLQLRAPWEVVVPFAPTLARRLGCQPAPLRLQRTFSQVLAVIKATPSSAIGGESRTLRGAWSPLSTTTRPCAVCSRRPSMPP